MSMACCTRTRWLLGLDKTSLRLVIGFITGHCEIRLLTWIWYRSQPDYCRVCCDEEELETIEHLLYNHPAFRKLRLRTLGKGFFEELELYHCSCVLPFLFCLVSVDLRFPFSLFYFRSFLFTIPSFILPF